MIKLLFNESDISKNNVNEYLIIDKWYEKGRQAGALGGKILGAGGGGFLMFYCPAEHRLHLRNTMAAEGLREMSYQFDKDGAKVLMNT